LNYLNSLKATFIDPNIAAVYFGAATLTWLLIFAQTVKADADGDRRNWRNSIAALFRNPSRRQFSASCLHHIGRYVHDRLMRRFYLVIGGNQLRARDVLPARIGTAVRYWVSHCRPLARKRDEALPIAAFWINLLAVARFRVDFHLRFSDLRCDISPCQHGTCSVCVQ
jgi:hypothetical protein